MFNHRALAISALTALAVGVLAACGATTSDPFNTRTADAASVKSPASTPSTSSEPPMRAPSTAGGGTGTFGPTGYDGVQLGMTAAQAKAAGATPVREAAGCSLMRLKDSALPGEVNDVILSPAGKVVQITASGTATSPEGVRIGSLQSKVLAAWPGAKHDADFWSAPVPGNPDAKYLFDFNQGQLSGMTLVTKKGNACAG